VRAYCHCDVVYRIGFQSRRIC